MTRTARAGDRTVRDARVTAAVCPRPAKRGEGNGEGPVFGREPKHRRHRANTLFAVAAVIWFAACGGSSASGDGSSTTFQAPDDSTGGYVLATVPAGMGTVRATVFDAGGAELGSFVADAPSASLSFWWTTGPGQTTRIALRDEGGGDFAYELDPSYVPVADAFEPNDAMDAATQMPDGGQMSAFLFAGRSGGAGDPAAYDDYYRFTAQPGALSIRLDDVPADLAARLFLFRADGSEVARVSNGLRGAPLALNAPALTDAAELTVRVSLWDEVPPAAGPGTELPASFTQPYRLTVSQPQP